MRLLRLALLPLPLLLATGCFARLHEDSPRAVDDDDEEQPVPSAPLDAGAASAPSSAPPNSVPPGSTPPASKPPTTAPTPVTPSPTITPPSAPTTTPLSGILPGTGTFTGSTFPTPTPAQAAACAARQPPHCDSASGCNLVTAYVVEAASTCPTGEKRSSCLAVPSFCGLLGSQIATDSSGRHYRVAVGCLPGDLTPLSPQPSTASAVEGCGPSAPADAACALNKDRASCSGDPRWSCFSSMASRFDPVRRCVEAFENTGVFLGCVGTSQVPGPPSYFRDEKGEIWQVPAYAPGPLPPSWQAIDPASVLAGAPSLTPCYTDFL